MLKKILFLLLSIGVQAQAKHEVALLADADDIPMFYNESDRYQSSKENNTNNIGKKTVPLDSLKIHNNRLHKKDEFKSDFTVNIFSNERYTINDSNFYFGLKFLKTTFANTQNNFIVSPLSVYIATAILANGAVGKTRKELENILNLPESDVFIDMKDVNKHLSDYMQKKRETIKIVNTLEGEQFSPEYITHMKEELFSVDFKKTGQNVLELKNVVDFKDVWSVPFSKSATKVKDFYSLNGKIDKVDMMYDYERLVDYYQDEKMQVIKLPYENGNVMHVFLPKENINFNNFIQQLSVNDLYLNYQPLLVEIYIPKFHFDYQVPNLIADFKGWGIKDIFSLNANLRKLSEIQHYVGQIVHRSKITIDEKGTKASSYTGMTIQTIGIKSNKNLKPKKWKMLFKADRPFIFMINYGDFIGVYSKGERF